jgi:hypothetical protein
MFYHVVMMTLSKDADAAFHAKVEAFAAEIRKSANGLVAYDYGRNLADRGKGYDWAVVGAFTSSADHDAYQVSDVHQRMKAFMTPVIADLVVCDFETQS